MRPGWLATLYGDIDRLGKRIKAREATIKLMQQELADDKETMARLIFDVNGVQDIQETIDNNETDTGIS